VLHPSLLCTTSPHPQPISLYAFSTARTWGHLLNNADRPPTRAHTSDLIPVLSLNRRDFCAQKQKLRRPTRPCARDSGGHLGKSEAPLGAQRRVRAELWPRAMEAAVGAPVADPARRPPKVRTTTLLCLARITRFSQLRTRPGPFQLGQLCSLLLVSLCRWCAQKDACL
jgi:hypothetical protein